MREVLVRLAGPGESLASIVQNTTAPRRTVEELLGALGVDIEKKHDVYRFRPDRINEYRERFDFDQLKRTELGDPLAGRLRDRSELLRAMRDLIRSAPVSNPSLDHVPATAETVVRRALWLDSSYDLDGSHILFVGDHDLTSLAMAMLCPQAEITVVDIDDRILEFIGSNARDLGMKIRCLHADFRLGLPKSAVETADLVFTDPPYTPEGIKLFLARGVQGLRNTEHARLIMAYGYSPRQPALGLSVQRAVLGLGLALEGIIPGFNRYDGAEAIGSAADLYICQPTAKSRQAAKAAVALDAQNIYTHGRQSVETTSGRLGEAADAVLTEAGEPVLLVGSDWPRSATGSHPHTTVGTLLSSGMPAAQQRRQDLRVVANLLDDDGSRLLRLLLAANASRVVAVVSNHHPDIRTGVAQQELQSLAAPKYRLRFRRSWPGPQYAVVEADRIDPDDLDDGDRPVAWVQSRAHGKVGNIWRDALVNAHPDAGRTKNEARGIIRDVATVPDFLEVPLIELARHDITTMLEDVRRSVRFEAPSEMGR